MTPAEAALLLGVRSDADAAEIMHAFRRSARSSHPDLLVGASRAELTAAEERFVRVSAARDILLKKAAAPAGTASSGREPPETDLGPGQWFTSPSTGRRVFVAEPEPVPLPPSTWALTAWVALLGAAVALSYFGGPLPRNPLDLVLRMIPLATFAVVYAITGRRPFLVLGVVWAAATAVMTFALASFGSLLALEILLVPLLALGVIGNRKRRRREAVAGT
ncbi:J domain-containing protein [Glaciihabitans tibetensis]|nr:J domain-containing protein [Glaciihabitans tibetensis]